MTTNESALVRSDHVHLFLRVMPQVAPSQLAQDLQGGTSRTLKQEVPYLQKYKAFCSPSYVVDVEKLNSSKVEKFVFHPHPE